ncbi:transcription factor grauzone-like isoform X1 [Bradysia coprophila]|uniref:transcription factor grauzone-like isoform X1 n=1 Tax=Bradysia coprophila TaxID=38358 RepID=UPI00187D908D|nr:transcription factor grauzone-like isoform X1 [Bradysia coprophila]
MGSTQLCRLCLQASDDVLNIWETFLDSTIAAILAKHFWFQVHEDDGLAESICEMCWIHTKEFHEFYRRVEQFQKCVSKSTEENHSAHDETIHIVHIKQELNVDKCEEVEMDALQIDTDCEDVDTKPDLNGIEYEEVEMDSLQISSSEYEDDEGETERTVDDEDQSNNHRQKNDEYESSRSSVKKSGRLSLSEKLELESHITELFNMNCEICSDVQFRTLLEARKHYRKVHETEGFLMCCNKKFHQRVDVVQHIRHHINLTEHGPSEQMEQEAQIRELFAMKCDVCSDIVNFETLLEVRQHYRKVHKSRGYLICCDKKFYRRIKMMNHVRWHTNSDTYSCNECGKRFSSKYALKLHKEYHIPYVSRPFKCSLCPSGFVKEVALKVHIQYKHTSTEEGNFACDKCSKRFRTTWSLTSHIRHVHESNTEYVCEVCARIFKSKTALKQHFTREHSSKPPPSPPPKVQCSVCGAWLKRKQLLSRHLKQHKDAKPVNCPVCNKLVHDKRLLDGHIRSVHAEKRHQCIMCGKAFKCAKNLREHLAIHTGEDLYDCPYCEKKFKSNANMYSHRKKAHLAEWTKDNKTAK